MPYVTSEKMLLDAQRGGYAIGAFNAENMEMVMAIIAAAEEMQAPVMIQTTPSTVKYAGLDLYRANVYAAAAKAKVDVCLHLDHGSSFDLAVQAIKAGYSSVMIDGSHSPLEENIAVTSAVVNVARPCGIPVEAELGKVGGKEDDLVSDGCGYTDPDDAVRFVAETGVSSLAVAIGTAHGIYSGTPVLDVDRLRAIRKVVDIPLVLHGASGLSDDAVRETIAAGICKVNFATELRIAYSDGVKEVLAADPGVFDPKKYGKVGMARVTELVKAKIAVCRG